MIQPAPPNVLFVIVDGLGTRLGCYGEAPGCSPALDRLADEGIRFENHFCTAPFCTPSRGSIFTGLHPHTTGLMGATFVGWVLPETHATLSQILARGGYETFLFGMQDAVADRARLGEYFHSIKATTAHSYCEEVAPHVAQFLESRGTHGTAPFYTQVGFSDVHRPLDRYVPEPLGSVCVPPYLKDTPGAREDFAMFHGAIRTMDGAVGRMLDALDRSGLSENTIVVFTTEHGIAFPCAKATLYDPGIRTTLLFRWPAGLDGATVVKELVSSIDVCPTLLEAAAMQAPADVQGVSLLSLLRGEGYAPREQIYAEQNTVPGDIRRCIRTRRHKYIRNYYEGPRLNLPLDIETSLTRRDMGDDHLAPRAIVELYDLVNDPLEFTNLAGRPAARDIEADLASRLDRFLEETGDPIVDGPVPRPPGEERALRRIFAPEPGVGPASWSLPEGAHHPLRDFDAYFAGLDDRWTGARATPHEHTHA